jgi:hypothetical protein
LLYFLSGVGLLIVAVYGLKQLHLLKEDIRTRNTRAAREKALESATIYAREFIPNYKLLGLALSQPFSGYCLYGARNRLQDAI